VGRVVGLGGDDRDWFDRLVIGALDLERLDHAGQHQGRLGQRELSADADARPDAERHIREAIGRWRTEQKPGRIEDFRLRPQPPVAVQYPRSDEHDRASQDRNAAGVVVIARLAHQRERWWVEAQRLVHDSAGIDQLWQCLGGMVRA